MARIYKEQCKLCRREGTKLFLKGEKCYSPKCPVAKRPYAPGIHGLSRRRMPSDYGLALREKQKAKRIYGILEKQFRNYFKKADRKEGITGEILLQLLEMRLDNVLFKSGLAHSLREARQLVSHNMFEVNGKKVNIPSYQLKIGDKIEVAESDKKKTFFENLKENPIQKEPVSWLKAEPKNLKTEVLGIPKREEIDIKVSEQLIVELYSK